MDMSEIFTNNDVYKTDLRLGAREGVWRGELDLLPICGLL